MTITKIQVVDQILSDEYGNIMYRETTRIMEDGVQLSQTYHRSSLAPGASLTGIDPKVALIAQATWTPEVIAPFTAAVVQATADQATAKAALDVATAETLAAQAAADAAKAVVQTGVPQQVTMTQARLALLSAGMYDKVQLAIDVLPEPQKTAAQIQWDTRPTVERTNGLLTALASTLGLTDAQVDALFVAAAKL